MGANAFAHEAGIHQDGILKNPLTYEIIVPETVGVPARRLVLGKHSGRNAFRSRLAELGYETTDAELAECYRLAMVRADAEKEITDRDLISHHPQSAPRPNACAVRAARQRANVPITRVGKLSMTQMRKTIAVLPGDGIGPEVTRAAVQLLKDCAAAFGHHFEFREFPFGGNAIDRCGEPLPAETLAGCRSSDAILLGAIGGPKWEALPLGTRPEAGLLGLRKELGLYINLRPIRLRPALRGISPLRPERLGDCDFEIVRELAGDIYFGEHEIHGEGARPASDLPSIRFPKSSAWRAMHSSAPRHASAI